MKRFIRILALSTFSLVIASCGQRSNSGMAYRASLASASDNFSSERRGLGIGNTLSTSGTTGSPSNAISSGTGQVGQPASSVSGASNSLSPNLYNSGTNSFSSVDFWGNLVQNTATDPQQCANLYNKYQRYPGNFESALSVLGACLNRVMIVKNPNLFQAYLYLYQQQYGSGYGSGYSYY